MSPMIIVDKVNEETNEPYKKFAWPAEGKTYSDFRHMESLLMKLANYMQESDPDKFFNWFANHQDDADLADLIIQELPGPGGEL